MKLLDDIMARIRRGSDQDKYYLYGGLMGMEGKERIPEYKATIERRYGTVDAFLEIYAQPEVVGEPMESWGEILLGGR